MTAVIFFVLTDKYLEEKSHKKDKKTSMTHVQDKYIHKKLKRTLPQCHWINRRFIILLFFREIF